MFMNIYVPGLELWSPLKPVSTRRRRCSAYRLRKESDMPETTSRRAFFSKTAAAGALYAASAPQPQSQETRAPKKKSPASGELLKVGIVTCGYYSHIEDIWGRLINPIGLEQSGAYWPRQTGLLMTMVWDADPKAAETFSRKYDVPVVKRYDDMLGKVDGVIFSDYYATGWWPQLSRPYLEAGVPCLINRPFALSLRDAKEMIDRAKLHNAPILVPSSDEYMLETLRARHRLEALLGRAGIVTGAMAFEPCGEYAAHGVHSIYNLYAILRPNVIAVNLIADTWWEWGNRGGMMNWIVKGEKENSDYMAAIRMSNEGDTNGWVCISSNKGRVFENNDHEGDVITRYRNMFVLTLMEFEKMIQIRKQPQTFEHIMAKTTTFLTGFYSHREKTGDMVACADLPEDWRAPEVMPERIPKGVL